MTIREKLIHDRRDELLTVKEYARLIRQHVESVRRRIRAGSQPGAVRVGGQWRIDLSRAHTGHHEHASAS